MDNPDRQHPSLEIISQLQAALLKIDSTDLPTDGAQYLQKAYRALDELSESILSNEEGVQEALHQARQEKDKFVSVVTHELRLPLTSIKGYTDLLRQGAVGPVNQQQLSFLDTIRNNVDRMSALLSDLADISKIDSGRLIIEIGQVSLPTQLDVVLQNLQPMLQDKQQKVDVSRMDQLPPVSADANRLTQVLTNLLRNASMYTADGGRISVRAYPSNETLHVDVSDTGIGISPDDQKKLFTPFFRADEIVVREQHGWGLGLYLSARLIELMGGRIGAESSPENGSTFWFTLPMIVA
jgi:signal transduction histidine kinase